jgi:magnesium-transporting ATPase (P-type)
MPATPTTNPPNTEPRPWHCLAPGQVLAQLDSASRGLLTTEANDRLRRHGPNRLQMAEGPAWWRRVLAQFNNLLILVLLAAVVVTALIGHLLDSAVILAVVLLNVSIGVLQEGKAEKALAAIRHLLAPHASVWRDGRLQDIDAADLVPGDVVQVASGDSLPADLRWLQLNNLRVDESALTGESVPVEKAVAPVAADAALGDRLCMGYAGTLVTQGQARGVVVATASATEMGRIGRLLESVEQVTTPLVRNMGQLARWITLAVVAAQPLCLLSAPGARHAGGRDVHDRRRPGGGRHSRRDARHHVHHPGHRCAAHGRAPCGDPPPAGRRNPGVGDGDLLRQDRHPHAQRDDGAAGGAGRQRGRRRGGGLWPEGALRRNGHHLQPAELFREAPVLLALAEAAALCNDASLHHESGQWQLAGDPTEGALLTLAMKAGIDPLELARERPRTGAIPFESEHRYMATAHAATEDATAGHELLLKGAPERVLAMCSHQLADDGQAWPLDDALAARHRRTGARRPPGAGSGARPCGRDHGAGQPQRGRRSDLLGLVGIIDPPRRKPSRRWPSAVRPASGSR